MRTAADLQEAADAAGLELDGLEDVAIGGGTEIAARMSFEDPWAAARLLLALSEQDARDPAVRAWALDMLAAAADASGAPSGPTLTRALRDATARTIHASVQRAIRFLHEPGETFQSARVTMQTAAGDCDDHARLVFALARAAGVPVELVFFEQDDQPIHVVARMQDSNGIWQWAETTIAAGYGEDPHDALERLGELPDADNPFLQGIGAPSGWRTLVSPVDVLAYRRIWDPFITATARAAVACAVALEAAAATASDPSTLLLAADTERVNADALMTRWNLHAGTPDYEIVINAADILQDQQDAVLKAGQVYQAQIRTDCPSIELPAPPGIAVQTGVIGAIEGFGILAHGVLQLIGQAAGGAIETLGPIVNPSSSAWSTAATIAVAAAVGAAALFGRDVVRALR
jgi:hypothetical protein